MSKLLVAFMLLIIVGLLQLFSAMIARQSGDILNAIHRKVK